MKKTFHSNRGNEKKRILILLKNLKRLLTDFPTTLFALMIYKDYDLLSILKCHIAFLRDYVRQRYYLLSYQIYICEDSNLEILGIIV